jgi:checkpoint serine/threonine-protein kinase
LDDIIDIFSRPLKSQHELDAEESTDDESDAASLTSRSFGTQSDVEESKSGLTNERPEDDSPSEIQEEQKDEVNPLESAENSSPLDTTEETVEQSVETDSTVPLPTQEETILPEFSTPAPPPIPAPQFQPLPERRFNLNLMTPIEERTESSLFQHTLSQDDTVTLHSPLRSRFPEPRTPPQRQREHLGSSPFEEFVSKRPPLQDKPKPRSALQPKRPEPKTDCKPVVGPIIKELQCNPMDAMIRQQIFEGLRPAISTYEGYTSIQTDFKQVTEIEKFITRISRKDTGSLTQSLEMKIQLGDTEYLIRKKLGQGAFAPVFLAENTSTAELRAIKIEKNPPSQWEFYVMRQANRRLGISRAGVSMIDAHELYLFRDESYLVLEYRDQGTILDLVNAAKVTPIGESTTGVMDEILAMFLTVELVRTVEGLHSKNILHGDLKADNCLVRLDEGELDEPYRRDGTCGWSTKGIALIDFGRGIDMKLFLDKVQFIADWETDDQDCPEMREMRPWTYQVDYWGLAGIIHSMLYGKYISTRTEPVGMGKKRYLLKESLKRYWQQDLWKGLLDVLLNPGLVAIEEGGLPITNKLRECREKMEAWLEENSEKGMGLRAIIRRIEGDRKP